MMERARQGGCGMREAGRVRQGGCGMDEQQDSAANIVQGGLDVRSNRGPDSAEYPALMDTFTVARLQKGATGQWTMCLS